MRVLLANEAGGGRGHVTTLAAAARALGAPGACLAALGRLTYADDLAGLCDRVVQAPLLARPRGQAPTFPLRGSATWGDVLAEIGLEDPAKVARGLGFWRGLIVREDIGLMVADFAPLALRAAQGLRDEGWAIRCVTLGTGYSTPPPGLARFPVYLADHDRITRDEAATLAVLNAAGAAAGIEPLPRLAALYDQDESLATTLEILDPYRCSRPPGGRVAPLVPAAAEPARAGDGVFVYFSTAELTDPALVAALEGLPLPRRGYLPSASADVRAQLAASGMELLDRPAPADAITAYARLIVHAAPHGTLCLAALAGLPQVGIPQHLEQLFNARAAAAQGVLRIGLRGDARLGALILAAYRDRDLAQAARGLARRLRADHPPDPLAMLRARLLG